MVVILIHHNTEVENEMAKRTKLFWHCRKVPILLFYSKKSQFSTHKIPQHLKSANKKPIHGNLGSLLNRNHNIEWFIYRFTFEPLVNLNLAIFMSFYFVIEFSTEHNESVYT